MNRKGRFLLLALAFLIAVNAAVVLAGRSAAPRNAEAERGKLSAKWKKRISDMVEARQYQEAIPTLRNYLRHAPDDVGMRRVFGKVLFEAGRFAEAEDAYYAALMNDPEDFVSRNNIGIVMMRRGRVRDALRELKYAFETSGQELFVAANLIRGYELCGRAAEAAAVRRSLRGVVGASGAAIPDDALMLADFSALGGAGESGGGRSSER